MTPHRQRTRAYTYRTSAWFICDAVFAAHNAAYFAAFPFGLEPIRLEPFVLPLGHRQYPVIRPMMATTRSQSIHAAKHPMTISIC
jgi:hypothetical protein